MGTYFFSPGRGTYDPYDFGLVYFIVLSTYIGFNFFRNDA